MKSGFGGGCHVMTRREAIGGVVAAAAAVVVPGRSWASALALQSEGEKLEYLWFPDESSNDTFHAYVVEQDGDGALWIEYDDGNAYRFAPGEWSLESLVDGHRLWLWETADAWYGYRCLTDSEAEVLTL